MNILLRITAAALFCFAGFIASSQLPAGFIRERIASQLNPTSMATAPDGRIFITEKNGTVRIIRNDEIIADPFLTLEVDESNERGLGHIVFHPDFETNGYLYLYYAVPGRKQNRVSRFTANGDKAIPGSELILMDMDQMGSDVHNGGDMVFGQDGYLYISTGDGGQNWRGEDPGSTNAKILRMDDEGNAVPDNPFYTSTYQRQKFVYALGFRNPFTMTVHPFTGEIYANDVGGTQWEEINRIEKGKFYGWPKLEGKLTTQEVPDNYQDPVYAYSHNNFYCCIVGAAIYAADVQQFPEAFRGKYFYSDYCTGHIHTLNLENGQDEGVFISDGDRIVDIEVARDGSLYYLERKGLGDGSAEDNTSSDNGMLWKVTYTGSGAPHIALHPQSLLISQHEVASFSVQASGAETLLYTWFLNSAAIQTSESSTFALSDVLVDQDSSLVYVIVSNSQGTVTSDTAVLRVTSNHRPQPTISQPGTNAFYRAGDQIHFVGFSEDVEDGVIDASGLSWRIDFHHGTHSHPAMPWRSGIAEGEYTIPSSGETAQDVWYRVYLRATDSQGLSQVTFTDIFPQSGMLQVETFPKNLTVALDGKPEATPYAVHSVIGVKRYLSPPVKQIQGDSVYFFESWSDGNTDRNREVSTADQNQTYTAVYSGIKKGKGTGLTARYYDNQFYEEPAVHIAVDSIIDHNFFGNKPIPQLPEDWFSITWNGYLQPYRSGDYILTVFSDDGSGLTVNDQLLFQADIGGFHNLSDTVYLEAGRLYSITLRYWEEMYFSQVQLRWSSGDWDEEVIPSSQLYPETVLTSHDASRLRNIETLVSGNIQVVTESFIEGEIDYQVYGMNGRLVSQGRAPLALGTNTITLPLDFLPAGQYILQYINPTSKEKIIQPWVKIR